MRQNAAKALQHASRGGDCWQQDDLVVDAVANRVRQVTELAKYQFPDDEKSGYPQVPWDELARARDSTRTTTRTLRSSACGTPCRDPCASFSTNSNGWSSQTLGDSPARDLEGQLTSLEELMARCG